MKFKNSHKALAITFLIAGTLVLGILSLDMFKYNVQVSETLIDITPVEVVETTEEQKQNELQNSKSTNKAYNETKKYKHFAQAYKPIAPPEDFIDPRLENREHNDFKINKATKTKAKNTVNKQELTSFNGVNSILKKRANASANSSSEASANKNSSILYSLKGRTDTFLPVPVYLCESSGKIVVNITVSNTGKVIKTAINNASNSTNSCLQDYALDYAKNAHFNPSSKTSQIGTITFYFKGK